MTGWNEHGHAVKTGLPIDKHLGSGDLQDAENCGYAPTSVLAEMGVDAVHGDAQIQFRDGRIVLLDGTVLERGGTLNCVWAVTHLPPYTEADVDRLAQIIDNAREAGIHHGNYTLARWILDRWPVQGSTPEDKLIDEVITDAGPGSIPLEDGEAARPVVANLAKIRYLGETLLSALQPLADATNDMVERLGQTPGSTPLDSRAPACGGTTAHGPHEWWPNSFRKECPGVPAPADEPAPVPPPVDAQLALIKELIADYGFNMRTAGRLQEQGPTAEVPALGRAASYRDHAWIEIDRLWAAGVEEGRRQRDAEIHASVFTSARLAAAEAGFGPAPESVTVSYDVDQMVELRRRLAIYGSVCEDLGESGYAKCEPADVKGVADAVLDYARQSIGDAYAAGVAEGRRQATEERTEKRGLSPDDPYWKAASGG